MNSNIRYGSVCSGIEAATVAWHDLGWEAQWFSEIEKFPSQVLAHHYPEVPNLGDMTLLTKNPIFNERPIDLLVGGTPCQSFSVAGLRHGLADSRGNLSLEFVRLLIAKQPRWFVWENVPGVLSSAGGADFASILSAFTGRSIKPQKFAKSGVIQGGPDSDNGAGYSIAYRVLDSQYFGVPQRRRRVFVVGHLGGDWRPPTAVLLERESLRRDFTPSREPRQKATGFTPTSFGGYGEGVGTLKKSGGDLGGGSETLSVAFEETVGALMARDYKGIGFDDVSQNKIAGTPHMFKVRAGCEGGGKGHLGQDELAYTLSTGHDQDVAYGIPGNWIGRKPENGGNAVAYTCATKQQAMTCEKELASTMGANDHKEPMAVAYSIQGSMVGCSEANGPQGGGVNEETSFTLNTTVRHAVAYGIAENPETAHCLRSGASKADKPSSTNYVTETQFVDVYNGTVQGEVAATMTVGMAGTNGSSPKIMENGPTPTIRRLTPTECERLQGFPDGYTLVPGYDRKKTGVYGGNKGVADGPRYKALGNSMTTNVMKWIGTRIEAVNTLLDVL